MFPKYRITAKNAEALALNEPDRWVAAEDDLTARNKMLRRGQQFTADQIQRLVGLAVLVELGVVKRTFPQPRAIPAEASVGEPTDG
jgi:hypothetical protein